MDNGADNDTPRRVIKRYSNRKLYDTRDSRYVTLLQIAEMVRAGEDVQIIDNTTKEDKTEVTLALAISEELKTKPRSVPLGTLRTLIQERGEKLLTSLRDGPIGRVIVGAVEGKKEEGADTVEAPVEGKEPEAEVAAAPVAEEAGAKHESRLSLAELVASSRATLDQWQHAIDERVRTVLPLAQLGEMRAEIRRLSERVAVLEQRAGIVAPEPPPAEAEEPAAPHE